LGQNIPVMHGVVNDHDLAQDMAQETFITVWEQLSAFRNEANISTWIYRIATNNCLRQLEKKKRIISTELSASLPEENKTEIEPQIQLLYKFIGELPEIDRIIISLELEDVKQAEIAQIVGLSESNIRVKIHRIKAQLAKKFEEYEN
jgi:RNA polymerase sigma-70 factor (ECF subfamily)